MKYNSNILLELYQLYKFNEPYICTDVQQRPYSFNVWFLYRSLMDIGRAINCLIYVRQVVFFSSTLDAFVLSPQIPSLWLPVSKAASHKRS